VSPIRVRDAADLLAVAVVNPTTVIVENPGGQA